MKKISTLLLSLFVFLSIGSVKAAHIIGGEITYTCLGGNQYEITLILYRDCAGGGADFDSPAHLGIYNSSGLLIQNVDMPYPSVVDVPPDLVDPCLEVPPGICVQQGTTSVTVTLPDATDTYTIVYQRCCRNAGILNIVDPGGTGATWWHEILPDTTVVCNSSPAFNNYPPIVICSGVPFTFDNSASDPDGDSLAYKFITPYAGADVGMPAPTPPPPPPYIPVVYNPGYTYDYPLDGSPAFVIDPATGIITGTPTVEGRFVVGIGVEEWRDGVLLGVHYRDFQFNVTSCSPAVTAATTDYVLDCEDNTVTFTNTSSGASVFFWDFGDGVTSTDIAPTHTYPDTGSYHVMLVANPGFPCADTTFAVVDIFNTLTANYAFIAGCSGNPVVFTDGSVTTEAGVINSWNWNFDDGTTSTEQNPSHLYADGGVYAVTLTVQTDKGCISTFTDSVHVVAGPIANFSVDDVCFHEPAEFNNLTIFAPGTSSAGYTWDFGDGTISNDDNPFHVYSAPGTYNVTLIASAASGCSDTITLSVTIGILPDANAGPDDYVGYLENYTLNGTGTGTFAWSPAALLDDATSANPNTKLEDDQTFILTVTSPDGCVGIDTVTIFVIQRTIIAIPNAFSPNGDGQNDELFVLNHAVNELLEYSIYNRWGQQVFTTTDITKGWDGKFKDKDQEMGTYVYVIRAKDMDNKEIQLKGNVALIR